MSDTPSGTNVPPKAQPSPPPPNESLDLSKWKGAASTAEPTPTETKRPRDPKVDWASLAGIAGLTIVRIGTGITTKPHPVTKKMTDYPWVGSTVHLPPTKEYPQGKNVFALTAIGENGTVAGGDLMRGLRSGVFDSGAPVPVHVRTQMNPDFPHGRPMAFLTLG